MMGFSMSRATSWWKVAVAGLVVVAAGTAAYLFLPNQSALAKGPLGRAWPADQRVPMDRIDHTVYDRLLHKYVDKDGYVDYASWKQSSADRRALRQYLEELSRADTRTPGSREAQLAFWINAYNAVTLEGILQVYPTSSIRKHTGMVGYNIWDDLLLQVGDARYSLNDMEHKILRRMREPRIHFAIVCASVGCPRLRNEAYTANRIEEQLADNARDFFSRSKNFRYDAASRTMYVSSILKWFGEDFGRSQQQRFSFLQRYLPKSAQAAAVDPSTRVRYLEYDWSLNDQARRRRTAAKGR